jgi:hypothetical protein
VQQSSGRWHATAGVDWNRAEGYSHDAAPGKEAIVLGGIQTQAGGFGQFDITAGPVQFFAGARFDATGCGYEVPFIAAFGRRN